ncbi:MAG: hypothetical protein HY243_07730 [Proteobacteria bacterium]|nr:hypothetical protein [Pseudomonadota bacterium]
MSIQFRAADFERARALQALVLVGLGRAEAIERRDRGAKVHPISWCRMALHHARLLEIPVLYAQHGAVPAPVCGMKDLGPKRSDGVFARHGPSCFDNPYFAEAAAQFERLTFAGVFNGQDLRLAAVDARRAGNKAVFLSDAIEDRSSQFSSPNGSIVGFAHRGDGAVRIEPTASWIAQTGMRGSISDRVQIGKM